MIEINLLPEELKVKSKSKRSEINIKPSNLLYLIPVALGLLICIHIYLVIAVIAKNNQYRALNEKWKKFEPQKKALESYSMENVMMSEAAKSVQKLVEQRINWSEKLNRLSMDLPAGIWFTQLSASGTDLILYGSVVSLENDEMALIAKFVDNLKSDVGFYSGFNNLELGAVTQKSIGSYSVADFTLTGTLKSK